jgi:hypothetical protein
VIGWKLSKAELEIERLGERESGFWRRDLVTKELIIRGRIIIEQHTIR